MSYNNKSFNLEKIEDNNDTMNKTISETAEKYICAPLSDW